MTDIPATDPGTVAFLNSSTGGLPFGFYHLPNEMYGETYTGALRAMSPTLLLADLEAARTAGANVIVGLVGGEKNFKNADGTFSLDRWKGRLEPFRGIDFTSYIADGTIIGHHLIDEPQDRANWNGTQVSPATLDEMAMYSKQLWPTMATIVRTWPWYLKGRNYLYLDAAWAQYADRFGAVIPWLDGHVRDADLTGLALVMGINSLAGGNSTTGLPGFYFDSYSMDAAQLESVGGAMLDYPYPCAFVSWKYDAGYVSRSDIQSALTSLATKARARPFKTCRGAAASGTPPPPPPLPNQPPAAVFNPPSCTVGVPCQFSDGSSDSDGIIVSWSWSFGDGVLSIVQNPSNTYAAAGSYTVTLAVTDNKWATSSTSSSVTVLVPNTPPTAAFISPACTAGVPCQFSDGSSDSDGSIATRAWTFGDGASSAQPNPLKTYATAGSYNVTLTVSDDDGATSTVSHGLTVAQPAPPPGPPIVLSVRGWVTGTKQNMALTWSGMVGPTTNVYRGGVLIINTLNDGKYTNSRTYQKPITYIYKVCRPGTSTCSNSASVTFK